MTRRSTDLTAALSALALSLLIMIEAAGLKPGPARFPILVGIIMAVSALILGFKALRDKPKPGTAPAPAKRLNVTALLFPFITWLVVAMCIDSVGFYLGAFLFIVANIIYIAHKKPSAKEFAAYLCIAIVFMSAIWVTFSYYLDMYLPGGVLFD